MEKIDSKIVDIFIVGAPKAGTSSLYHYLSDHPDVSMCEEKEPNFFTQNETRNLYSAAAYRHHYKDLNSEDEYHELFNGNGIYGEASVSYLLYPKTASKIKRYNPNAKIIICLRNPVSRARSHHAMDKRLGFTTREIDYVFQEEAYNSVEFQQYITIGRYTDQILRYQECFPENQIKVVWFEDIKSNPGKVCEDLCQFLNIDYHLIELPHRNKAKFSNNAVVKYLYKSALLRDALNKILPVNVINLIKRILFRSSVGEPAAEGNNELYGLFRDDISALETLMNKDLSVWKKSDTGIQR